MEKLIARSKVEQGIIDGIERKSREVPASLSLERFLETKKNAYRVKAAKLSFEFDQKIKEENKQEYLDNTPSRKIRDKVSRIIEKREELALHGNAKGRYTMRRNQAMKAMIVDGVWSKELAKMYDITKEDVQVYHTEELRISVFLNFSTHFEFKKYLRNKAIKAFQVEKLKLDKYIEDSSAKEKKGLLRKILANKKFHQENNFPRLLIEQKLYARNEEGKSKIEMMHDELDDFHTRNDEYGERNWFHKGEEISQYEYNKGINKVKGKLRKLQEENEKLYKLFFLDNEANENMTFIKAVGLSELQQFLYRIEQYDNDITGLVKKPHLGITSIHVSSVGQGKRLIEIYCSWYNRVFKSEIEATKDEEEKARTARKNEKNRIESRTKKLDRDKRIIELRKGGEKNAVKIANLLDEKERTVREILTRYDNVVELYNLGVVVPEAISEQLKTKLSSVIHYIEIFTGESINITTLTNEQKSHQEREREQEFQARIEIEEREFRNKEREKINFWKREQENEVVRLHHIGWNPSGIQKFVNISVILIKNILIENSLTPHFDWKIATEEEREINLEKLKIKEQETKNKRKKINL